MIHHNFLLMFCILCTIQLNVGMRAERLYFRLLPSEIMTMTNTYLLHNNPELISILRLFEAQEELHNFLSKSKLSIEAFKLSLTKTDQQNLYSILSCKSLPPVTDYQYFNMVLFNSVRSNNPSMTKLLLYLGADKEFQNQDPHDPTLYNKTHYTLLAHAAECGYLDVTTILLTAGADPNPHHPSKGTLSAVAASPLICALQGNSRNTPKIVEMLLKAGAEINLPDRKNQTALSFLYNNPALTNARKAHEILKKHATKLSFFANTYYTAQ